MAFKYEIKIRAGPVSEKDINKPYRYTISPIPKGVKSVDEQPYYSILISAFEASADIVRKTGKDITLTLIVEERKK